MVDENRRWNAVEQDLQEEEESQDLRKVVGYKSQPCVPVHLHDLESFPNVLLWDDSGAVEALILAEERRRAALAGVAPLNDLPGPDLYIDKIDWNPRAPQKVLECADASAAAAQRSRETHGFRRGFQRNVKGVQGLSSQPSGRPRPQFSIEDMGQFPPLQSVPRYGTAASGLPPLPRATQKNSCGSGAAIQGQQQVYKKKGDSHARLAHPNVSGGSGQNQSGKLWVPCSDEFGYGD